MKVRAVINDGAMHPVDSSDIAFQLAARGGFREAYARAKPQVLEPIMKLEVSTPTEFQGSVVGQINQKRGVITGSAEEQLRVRNRPVHPVGGLQIFQDRVPSASAVLVFVGEAVSGHVVPREARAGSGVDARLDDRRRHGEAEGSAPGRDAGRVMV